MHTPRRILISGAGIAGPALAARLAHPAYEVTVVERSPTLREGGQAVDFRGPVHRAVLDRMEMWEPICAHRTHANDVTLLGPDERPVATLPAVMLSGDVEIRRGDLSRLLYERTRSHTAYRFGEQIDAVEEADNGVTARFRSGASETFDLVVGADGLHSRTRLLTFGDEARFLRHHGYRLATFSMPNVLEDHRGAAMFTVPGRCLNLTSESPERCRATFIFAAGPMSEAREDARQVLKSVFGGLGWHIPAALTALDGATDLYLDAIGTVALDRYAKGRVVLLGNAAWGGTLGGQGTPLAVDAASLFPSSW